MKVSGAGVALGRAKPAAGGAIEGPWALPEGWRWERLDDAAPVNPSRPLDALDDDVEIAFIPMAAVEAETGRICVDSRRPVKLVRQGFTRFSSGDVLFAKITPCMENGKIAIVPDIPEGLGCGSTEFHVLKPEMVFPKYLFYWLSQKVFRKNAEFNMTGTAGQKRVPTDFIRDALIPVPPSSDQHRIVSRIDSLFGDLDDGEAALARARTDLGTWRKSLLKAAVTGELTADWRAANPPTETGAELLVRILDGRQGNPRGNPQVNQIPLPDEWAVTTIGAIFDVFVGSTPARSDKELWNGEVPWVSSGEVSFCRISSTRESIARTAIGESGRRLHPPGTVMLGMIGEGKTRGQAAILDIWAAHNQNCASIRVSQTPILPEFVYHFLRERYEVTRNSSSGGNQPALNKARIEEFAMPLPPLAEQIEIIARVEAADAAWDSAVLDADLGEPLRQSILTAAFRGDLIR